VRYIVARSRSGIGPQGAIYGKTWALAQPFGLLQEHAPAADGAGHHAVGPPPSGRRGRNVDSSPRFNARGTGAERTFRTCSTPRDRNAFQRDLEARSGRADPRAHARVAGARPWRAGERPGRDRPRAARSACATLALASFCSPVLSGERVWQVPLSLAAALVAAAKAVDRYARVWCERAKPDDPGEQDRQPVIPAGIGAKPSEHDAGDERDQGCASERDGKSCDMDTEPILVRRPSSPRRRQGQ